MPFIDFAQLGRLQDLFLALSGDVFATAFDRIVNYGFLILVSGEFQELE